MPKRKFIGVVTSDRMNKTRRVEVSRLARHPQYGKYLRRRTICYVHDENNESHLGDTVEIIESRPLSRLKRWRLVRVVSRMAMAAREALTKEEVEEESPALPGQKSETAGQPASPESTPGGSG